MKQLSLLIYLLINYLIISAQPYSFISQAASNGNDEINFVKLSNDGGIVVSGNTDSNLTWGSSQLLHAGGFVAKSDAAGNKLWIVPAGINNPGFSFYPELRTPGISVDDSSNIYVYGSFSDTAFVGSISLNDTGAYNCFLAKLDPSGNTLWLRKVTDEGFLMHGTVDPWGDVIVTGYFWGTVQFDSITITSSGGGGPDILLAKYHSDGSLVWVKKAGGAGFYSDVGYAVDTDSSGNIYLGGHIRTDANFDTLTLLSHGIAGFDGFISKYNPAGDAQWVKYCGYECHAVAVDDAGNCYTGGYIYSTGYFDTSTVANSGGGGGLFIARINPAGIYQWVKINETNDFSWTLGLAADSRQCYATGSYHYDLTVHGGADSIHLQSSLCGSNEINSFIMCIDSSGSPRFAKTLRSCNAGSNAGGIDIKDCRLAATGLLRYQPGAVYFDNDSMIKGVTSDGYLAVIDTCLLTTKVVDIAAEPGGILIYPVPAWDAAVFKIDDAVNGKITVTIQNLEGKIIKHLSILKTAGRSEFPLPVTGLAPGIYFLNLYSHQKQWHKKFIKD